MSGTPHAPPPPSLRPPRAAARALVRLVDFYRARISRLLPRLCRFEPSCSAYAREALLRHGATKGILLAIWRVLRCNPLGKGGADPVPAPGRWR